MHNFLFLDEIGELPLDLQPKLLRVIQTKQFFRVGGNRQCSTDVRFVCATNRDLREGAQEGWFREDLYFRLASFPIMIPALRDRIDDLEALVTYFIRRKSYPHTTLDEDLLRMLRGYSWPGNVRELENLLDRAMILASGGPILSQHFPTDLTADTQLQLQVTLDLARTFKENLQTMEEALERSMINAQLKRFSGNREQAAGALGFSVKTLYNRMKARGLM